jgi:hypothetical protein
VETQLIIDDKPMEATEGHTCERRAAPLWAGFNGFLTAASPTEG